MAQIPYIAPVNGVPTLMVHGEPFWALSGEVHNSSASDPKYMQQKVWPMLEGLNLNSLIVPIYWELVEPADGVFDFSSVDSLIDQARDNSMHLILLWFGLWKNSESTYVPTWIKQDRSTYFLARNADGQSRNTISPFCAVAVEKDAQALAQVMSHIRERDEEQSTVIMIQVENEIGLLGTDRDYSAAGESAFAAAVPQAVATAFEVSGSWQEAFGEDAGEHLMAYAFACAVERIARKAKDAYDLPCFANAWLEQYPWYAGSYPSGGPVRKMHQMWKLLAPSLFTLAPDIYVPYVPQVLDEYSYNGNPLVVPEVRKDAVTASYALYAFGQANAICYSPFGIEELGLSPDKIDRPPMQLMIALNIDPTAFDIAGSKEYLARVYSIIGNIKKLLAEFRGTKQLQGCVKRSETDFGTLLSFSQVDLQVAYGPKVPCQPVGAALILEATPNSFYIIGMNCEIKLHKKPGSRNSVEVLRLQEGDFKDSVWQPGRVLNGDERMSARFKDYPSCLYIEVQ